MDDRTTVERGLCSSCVHARVIESSKGAVFVLCSLSYTDPRFARYPRLPVIVCEGYASGGSDSTGPRTD